MREHAADYPKANIEDQTKTWDMKFWVGTTLQLTEQCRKTTSPSEVFAKFKAISD